MAKQEKFTNAYWDKKGNGKYQADYDRLVKQLVPTKKKGSKAETVSGPSTQFSFGSIEYLLNDFATIPLLIYRFIPLRRSREKS